MLVNVDGGGRAADAVDDGVTMAIPGVPGLQMATVASQVPAQALPLLATESGAGSGGLAGVPLVTTN